MAVVKVVSMDKVTNKGAEEVLVKDTIVKASMDMVRGNAEEESSASQYCKLSWSEKEWKSSSMSAIWKSVSQMYCDR